MVMMLMIGGVGDTDNNLRMNDLIAAMRVTLKTLHALFVDGVLK